MNKKGFSLIEVVVALGILAFVFSGVVSLVVQVVNLELSARTKTEAVALAQKQLAEAVSKVNQGCSIDPSDPTLDVASQSITYTVDYQYSVSVSPSPDYGSDLGPENFAEVTVTVQWDDKTVKDNIYKISQVVKI